MPENDSTDRLMEELLDAKDWPARFARLLENGSLTQAEIGEADKKIEALERRAREAIKRLGCVSPETRGIYHGMADMLISWNTFKDALE